MKDILQRNLKFFLDGARDQELGRLLNDLHPADIAEIIEPLDEVDAIRVLTLLGPELSSQVMVELPESALERITPLLPSARLSEMVSHMDSDDAADILANLPDEEAKAVLAAIEPEESAEVRRLLLYDDDTAGGIMQVELISALDDETVADAVEHIRAAKDEVEALSYVFVVDRNNVLRGQIGLTTLLLATPGTPLRDLMSPCELVVEVTEDQEAVAQDFQKYDVRSAPVVDEHGRLLGRITVDDVLDVVHEEVDEDVSRMAGTSEEEIYSDKIFKISRLRLPWLIVNLIGGLVTGYLVWLFKMALEDVLALVTFIPAIMALGGSVGIQSSTIVVRGMALGRINPGKVGHVLFKEFRVALLMGLVCGLGGALVAQLWHRRPVLGIIVGLSMFFAITMLALLGAFAPAIFRRLSIDPALASGPFVTMCNDILGIIVYMGIATMALDLF
jgi:magnesium transporter